MGTVEQPNRTGQFGAWLTFPCCWSGSIMAEAMERTNDHREATVAKITGDKPHLFTTLFEQRIIKEAQGDFDGETPPADNAARPLSDGVNNGPFARLYPDHDGPRNTLGWKLSLYLLNPNECRIGEQCLIHESDAASLEGFVKGLQPFGAEKSQFVVMTRVK